MIAAQILGAAKVNANLAMVKRLLVKGFADDELMKIALRVERKAKQLCPVDTGRLRASLHTWRINLLTAAVGTDVEYASFVEYGTKKMAPQPYLRPALLSQQNAIEAMGGRVDVLDPTLSRLITGGFSFA